MKHEQAMTLLREAAKLLQEALDENEANQKRIEELEAQLLETGSVNLHAIIAEQKRRIAELEQFLAWNKICSSCGDAGPHDSNGECLNCGNKVKQK